MSIVAKAYDWIHKPVNIVFEAIVDADKISCYFVSRASASLSPGQTITWTWDEFDATLDIQVIEVTANENISFRWSGSGKEAVVNILLEPESAERTKITITEADYELNEKQVEQAMRQTQGWTDFICSLKAYLYANINLRSGKYN